MGRRNSKERKFTNPFKNLKEETLRGVLAVIFFVFAAFFILAAFGKAGIVGNSVYAASKYILGLGYFLLPVLLIMLSISFTLKARANIALAQIIGSFLFFLSGLGIVHLLIDERGGVLGNAISYPLLKFFDFTATMVILSALSVISFLIVFDTALRFGFISLILKKILKRSDSVKISDSSTLGKKEVVLLNQSSEILKKNIETEPPEKIAAGEKERKVKEDDFKINAFNFKGEKPYIPPPLSMLEGDRGKPGVGDIKANANIIKRTLMNFGIDVEMDEVSIGPTVTRYALKPAEGVKLSRIVGLQNDLSLALAAHPIRIEAPIPGKSLVGIEIPNSTKTTVGLGSLVGSEEFQKSSKPLLIALGRAISGMPRFANLGKMPHLMVAGATGSGKSVAIHGIITSLLYRNSPHNLKFIMIDPKRVELTLYNKIPHLLAPVITDPKKTILALKWAAKEMDRRYDILESESVRDIDSYHRHILEPERKRLQSLENKSENKDPGALPERIPYIVIVLDELADIMQIYPRELEAAVVRLAQMSRAVGIHLLLSTQRPSVNVITGLIKANIPTRIALQVSSQIDSRTILDTGGAEKLLGAGDMLYLSNEMSKPQRIQSPFISESEVKNVVKYLADNYKNEAVDSEVNFTPTSPNEEKNSIFDASFTNDITSEDDELYEEAREIVIHAGKASTSYLQRKLRIGYARAARLIDMLEERGVVGSGSGAKAREVLNLNGLNQETIKNKAIE